MTEVSLQSLTKTFPGAARPALDRLSLTLAPGSLTALLGPSGSGKTTAMRLVAGLLDPSSGDIRFDGQSVLSIPPERRGAVMVFQNHLLFPFMTVAQNVGFGLRMQRAAPADIAARVEAMLTRVQLTGLGARRPADLSGGQQQRVALARALILRPRLLLLDEPLSNLDPHLRAEMRDLIRDLQRETGITTLVVTHDQSEAVVLADRVALLFDGSLRQTAAPVDFYNRPADTQVARFFGGVNFIPGRSEGGLFHSTLGPLRLPPDARTGPGLLTFRPEAVLLGPETAVNPLTVRITDRSFLGTQTRLCLSHGDQRLEAVVSPTAAAVLSPDNPLGISLPPAALWVLPPD